MIPDPDVWRAASLMLTRYDDDAPVVTAQRADELYNEGDFEGAAAWRQILNAISELARIKPAEGERVN